MDATLSRPPAGQLLDGRYRVEAWLANGGMATVYLGTDTRLDRAVALKIAHPELAGDEEFIRRFMGEARSVARLSSPHVVAVYDQGTDGQFLYLAMEYVPGRTLRELLRERGRLGPREALDIIEGVLAGLAAAHEAGIVHRDVKPENVLLTTSNVVKVADFGLARAAAAASRTKTGTIIGTAAYLAPEQVSQSTSDARTDVYAAGVMLFELLTGTQPHTGGTPLDVAYKHVNDVVPAPSTVVPVLPAALDALVALATSRNPDLRPANAGQFLQAITEVRSGLPSAGQRAGGQHAARRNGHPDELAAGQADRGQADRRQAAAGPLGSGLSGAGAQAADSALGGVHGAAGLASAFGVAAAAGLPGAGGQPSSSDLPGSGGQHGWGQSGRHSPGHGHLAPAGGGPAAPFPWLNGGHDGGPADFIPPGREPASGSGAVNHTLIVAPGGLADDSREGSGRRRGRRTREYRPSREPMLQRLLFSRRLAYLAGGLAVVLAIVAVTWWLTAGQYTTVPQVRGMAASVARTELTNLGFVVKTGPGQHSTLPMGEVVRTSPAIGTKASQGSTVQLISSLGPVLIQVPQVTGMTLAQAQAALSKAGLTPGIVTSAPSQTIAAGIVVSTNPVAGATWPQPTPVALTVSAGPPLPNFAGTMLTAAQSTAQQGGYALNPVTDAKSSQPAGTITSQSPAPGSPITPHEVVTVHVSAGPPQVGIPNVTGMNVNQATKVLTAAGFNVAVNTVLPGHKVIAYSPTGEAPQGSTITLTVGFVISLP